MPEDLKLMVKQIRLLTYLGRDVVQDLAPVITTKELEAGSYLYRDGDPEDKLFVVKQGRIDLKVTDKVSEGSFSLYVSWKSIYDFIHFV